jgi:lysozyme
MERATTDCRRSFFWFERLSEPRQGVLVNMCFNMGIYRLLEFRRMLGAVQAEAWSTAAEEMKDSDWYKQVGARAERLCEQMRTDTWQ